MLGSVHIGILLLKQIQSFLYCMSFWPSAIVCMTNSQHLQYGYLVNSMLNKNTSGTKGQGQSEAAVI